MQSPPGLESCRARELPPWQRPWTRRRPQQHAPRTLSAAEAATDGPLASLVSTGRECRTKDRAAWSPRKYRAELCRSNRSLRYLLAEALSRKLRAEFFQTLHKGEHKSRSRIHPNHGL